MTNTNSPNKGGRPLKFKSVRILQKKIDDYFKHCDPHWTVEDKYVEKRDTEGKVVLGRDGYPKWVWKKKVPIYTIQLPYTISDLAVYLGTTRDTLLDYESGNRDKSPTDEDYDPFIPKFSDTIKAAKQKCQAYAERSLFSQHSTGSIFSLKNNYDWKDRTEVENNLNGNVGVSLSDKQAEQLIRARANRSNPEGHSG